MKNPMLILTICLAIFSCTKNVETGSACLDEQIEQFKSSEHSVSVLTIVSNGERVFKFRTVMSCGDGSVYNEKCEVVCPGGKHPVDPNYNCPAADYSEWEVVWEK